VSENNALQIPLLSVFRNDLIKSLPSLIGALNLLQTNSESETALKNLMSQINILKGEAKVVELNIIVEFCSALDNFLNKVVKKESQISTSICTVLTQVFNLWKELVETEDLALWQEFLEKQAETYKIAIHSLDEASSSENLSPTKHPLFNCGHIQPKANVEKDLIVDAALYDLFLVEVQSQTSLLTKGLLDFEQSEKNIETIEALMRAAHSIKGAARILRLDPLVHLSHAIEDCFVAVQKNNLILLAEHIDILLQSVDLLAKVVTVPQNQLWTWLESERSIFSEIMTQITDQILHKNNQQTAAKESLKEPDSRDVPAQKHVALQSKNRTEPLSNRVLRVTAQNLNRLMGLAGESLVESRWLQPFSTSLLKTKKMVYNIAGGLDNLREALAEKRSYDYFEDPLAKLQREINFCSCELSDRLTELDMFILRHSRLSDRLYREVVESRMRPFADVVDAFPRLVRDLSRELDKKIRLEISGKFTQVDRDILEILEAPLNHLIRNAADHGIESVDQRVKAGKNPEGMIKIEAMHRAGMLAIQVSDDGRGIDLKELRKSVVARNLVSAAIVDNLTEEELLAFLFLPGFSTKQKLSEISGRGIGMNAVSAIVHEVGGSIRVQTHLGKGTTFQLILPLTLSVLRALIAEVEGEPYAFPLAKIDRALKIQKEQVQIIENTQYIQFEGKNVGLVLASQVFDLAESKIKSNELAIIVISDRLSIYGVIVDKFLGEKELVVQEFDALLGKTPNLSAGGFLDDGSPVLIVDVEDLVRSIDNLLSIHRLHKVGYHQEQAQEKKKKKILVVDDSITVREVECRLLQNEGYEVYTAVNGVDGLNALHMGHFDLLITDIDMPRMDGIELIHRIRSDLRLKDLPVMIVSYKDREEDRLRGLEAGANYYLTKSSFHDSTLTIAVKELIGSAEG
jgi:two-component system sensor histidine kinase and response regulator WspE